MAFRTRAAAVRTVFSGIQLREAGCDVSVRGIPPFPLPSRRTQRLRARVHIAARDPEQAADARPEVIRQDVVAAGRHREMGAVGVAGEDGRLTARASATRL